MSKLPLSVCIISSNESDNIARCLESVKDIAEEIVIVDSHSTDDTVEIAGRYGAKVFDEDWKGHIAQKNSAMEKCTSPWILSLDCDEEVSTELRRSIVNTLSSPACDGYLVNRKSFFLGKWINYSWYPDSKLRLIKNGTGKWAGYDPHDALKLDGVEGRLDGDLLHYPFKSLRDQFTATASYAIIGAESYLSQGKKASLPKLIFNPFYSFVKHYIVKRGFLDGVPGLVIAAASCYYTFLKYALIWERQKVKSSSRG